MKKNILLGAVILSILIQTFSGCQKREEMIGEPESGFSVSEARNWFESGQEFNLSSKTQKASKLGSFIAQWEGAIATQDEKHHVLEFPVKFAKKPGFAVYSQSDVSGNKEAKGVTKLIILKNKITGNFSAALMHVISQNTNGEEITYKPTGTLFTGFIFFTDFKGTYLNGWEYQNGNIVRKGSKSSNQVNGKALPPQELDENCYTLITYWYERDCIEYYNGDYVCGEWKYIGSSSETYCEYNSSGGGGGEGGYTPTEEDCSISANKALNDLVNSSYVTSEILNITTLDQQGETRTKIYEWVPLKSIGWYLYSFEKGVHKKTSNPDPNLAWEWVSLEHQGMSMVGVTLGGNVEPKLISANPEVGRYNAIMGLKFSIKYSVLCKGSPLAYTAVYQSAINFHVNA